jgi:hypothetical protein
MKSKTTILWFVLAAALFAGIWMLEHYRQPPPPPAHGLLPGFQAGAVTGIQISPNGTYEISALRTNGGWQLTQPLAYPAQTTAIETLLTALENLAPLPLTAAEMRGHNDAEYGLDNPQFRVAVTAGDRQWQFQIGSRTAPGDQVFVRVVGANGAFVTDAAWLSLLPHSAADWRDTALVPAAGDFDWIVITNGTKVIELRRDATNHLWRMLQPLDTRADGPRLATALQQLQSARAAKFVTDDPKADLTTFGLQPAELDLCLGRGTNFTAVLHVGKKSPDAPGQMYVRRDNWNTLLTADQSDLAVWAGPVNDFRDTHLLELTAPVAEIEVTGENHFMLQPQGTNGWRVAGEKFAVETETVQDFLRLLAGLRITEFVKDNNTAADLQRFGLATPSRQIILRGLAGDTNRVLAQLQFGATATNLVFVKCAEDNFVYALAATNVDRLPENGWEFRTRHLWNFSETNVAQVTLRQNGQTRQLVRTGTNAWSLAAGSQGIIDPRAIEETVHRLGELTAEGWVGRNFAAPEKLGFNTNNLQIVIELKSGEKRAVDFGGGVPNRKTVFAAATLDGERWTFVFPEKLAPWVAACLTLPPNTP